MYGELELNEIQKKNMDTIDKFFHRERLNGENISTIFTPDGVKKFFRPSGEEWRFEGREAIAENFTSNKDVFSGWKYEEVKYYLTDDPNFIWALTYGSGHMKIPEYEGHFSNYYVDAFVMEDGLIKRFTEYNNPEHLLADFVKGVLR